MAIHFVDRDTDHRMLIRDIIDDYGGTMELYDGTGFQVTMPADRATRDRLCDALRPFGYVRGSSFFFPACNNEPEHQLHWKREQDRGHRGMALAILYSFRTIDDAPADV